MATPAEPGLDARERAAVLLLVAVLALLPFGSAFEAPLLAAAITGAVLAVRGRIAWRSDPVRLALLLFAAYWLPELVSAVDAVNAERAWREVAVDLRYLPFLLFACHALRAPAAQHMALAGSGLVLALWVADALLQSLTGWSLGGPAEADRLSGIFGAEDLKLGASVAVLSPFLLLPAFARNRALGALMLLAVAVVVLLAGTRAAWVSFALVLAVCLWRAFGGGRRAALALLIAGLSGVALGTAGYFASDSFAARIERSAAALEGRDGLDHALSHRLPIWRTALRMIDDNRVNGVGVRGFRQAYADYADDADRWLGFDGEAGAFHAHQLLLEVASETGAVGLFCWLLAAIVAWRRWREAAGGARAMAAPVSLALLAMLFPLNTHYAFYSSAWGGLLFYLLALWLPIIQRPGPLSRSPAPPAGGA